MVLSLWLIVPKSASVCAARRFGVVLLQRKGKRRYVYNLLAAPHYVDHRIPLLRVRPLDYYIIIPHYYSA